MFAVVCPFRHACLFPTHSFAPFFTLCPSSIDPSSLRSLPRHDLSFDFLFRRASTPDTRVPDFHRLCRSPSACASMRHLCASAYQSVAPFSPLYTLSRSSSRSYPRHPPLRNPLTPARLSFVTIGIRVLVRRHVLCHISPGLCINFSSLSRVLISTSNDQYFVTFRLCSLSAGYPRGIIHPDG